MKERDSLRVQSAMEYLMTYGWAILIIAVVLGALFGLGFFNSANLAPKIGPGSCQVYRPNGPGTTSFINLEGTCNNELPQYAAMVNGQSGNIVVPYSSSLGFVNSFTAVIWINPRVVNTYNEFIIGDLNSGGSWKIGLTSTGTVRLDLFNTGGSDFTVSYQEGSFSPNTWYQVAATFNGVSATIFINGVSYPSETFVSNTLAVSTNPVIIGQDLSNPLRIFNGLISNVQLYNTSLSTNEVAALYDEGIGGVPINTNNLVGWWPLNGNANDYSGNLNNGVPISVIYTSSWTSGYSAP